MKYETAGDPVSGLRWTRKTTEKIADELLALDIRVSRKTVAKLLKQNNFSLRTNKKKISNGSPPERDAQFATIAQLRERFGRRGNPILSVDTKKRELVGRFKNPGRVWLDRAMPSTTTTFALWQKGSLSHTASMISSVIAGPCMSERLTTHRNSRSNASRSGGGPKVRSVFPTADTYLSWLTLVGATAQPAVHGNTASNTSCATSTVCTSRSHTIHQERPSGTQSSTDCSVRSARIGRAGRSTATKPSLNFIRTTKTKTGLKVKRPSRQEAVCQGHQNLRPSDDSTQLQTTHFAAEVELHIASIQEWEIIFASVLRTRERVDKADVGKQAGGIIFWKGVP